MTTTLREFQRHFSRMQRAAESGQAITVRGRSGQVFVFKAVSQTAASVGAQMAHLAGTVKTGRRVKSLAGYGRR